MWLLSSSPPCVLHPTRQNYKTLEQEASDLASEVDNITFAWSPDTATGEEYGLLAEIISNAENAHLTNLNWNQEIKLPTYDLAMKDVTVTHTQKWLEEEWEEKRESWYNCKGFLRRVSMNMHDTLDEQYYLQLKHINTVYHNTTPIQIQEHLNTQWCPLDVHTKKLLKAKFHVNWDSTGMHLTALEP